MIYAVIPAFIVVGGIIFTLLDHQKWDGHRRPPAELVAIFWPVSLVAAVAFWIFLLPTRCLRSIKKWKARVKLPKARVVP